MMRYVDLSAPMRDAFERYYTFEGFADSCKQAILRLIPKDDRMAVCALLEAYGRYFADSEAGKAEVLTEHTEDDLLRFLCELYDMENNNK